MPPQVAQSRRRRRQRRTAKLAGLAFIGAGILLTLAVSCRPRWYQPVAVDASRLPADKAALAELQDRISAALNAGQAIRVRLTEDQVNRWLAGRGALEPVATVDLGPFQDPAVRFLDGCVRVGGRLEQGVLRGVASVTIRAAVDGGRLSVTYDWPRLGVVPVPAGWFAGLAIPTGPDAPEFIQAPRAGMLEVRNRFVWPNGRRRCRVTDIAVRPGVMEIALEPTILGP